MKMKKFLNSYENIDKEFYEIDEENKSGTIRLLFNNPKEIFSDNYISSTPLIKEEFMNQMLNAYYLIEHKYSVNTIIEFIDLDGYTEEELKTIFMKNLLYKAKVDNNKDKSTNRIGISLLLSGIIFLVALILIELIWKNESFIRTIVFYVMDILSTVTLWEALTILIVQRKEKNKTYVEIIKRMGNVIFKKVE